jgi:hypothetical protein
MDHMMTETPDNKNNLTVIAVAATPDDERRSELGSGGKRSRNILAA